jgi:hypothetical protein
VKIVLGHFKGKRLKKDAFINPNKNGIITAYEVTYRVIESLKI